ncbi:MAG: hypothetical protein Q7S01_04535 [bacterium]|nr:hypothetical protein [bacterium]
MIDQSMLVELYLKKQLSSSAIADRLGCSEHKVNYWLAKHQIKKRSISDAIYRMYHPNGDPFLFQPPRTMGDGMLYGLGLGLYWGEGSKRGKGGVRLCNTDVRLIKKFIEFLYKFFGIEKDKLKFGLQIFKDLSRDATMQYWMRQLKIKKNQFYKVIVSKVRGEGTYKYKSEYGVLTIHLNNSRLKELICKHIDNID